MNESIAVAILEELKKLNENIEVFTEIQLSHYIATGQILGQDSSSENLDSWVKQMNNKKELEKELESLLVKISGVTYKDYPVIHPKAATKINKIVLDQLDSIYSIVDSIEKWVKQMKYSSTSY